MFTPKFKEEIIMTIWRLQTKTGADHNIRIADYCLENNIAALGWRVDTDMIPSSYEEYGELSHKQYGEKIQSVERLANKVQSGDMIWMRNNGVYYLGLVGAASKWQYNKDKTAVENDACNQRTEVKWVTSKSADESIAGAVTTSFIRGQAFQRINKDGIEQYSKYAYNIWSGTNNFKDIELEIDNSDKCKAFFNLLTTSEAEDLVAFYLYKEKGYIVIPSTNKLSTPLYEFVLLDPQDCGKHIYIQVKKGNIDIDADKYSKLNGEVYLFTSEGNVVNAEKHSNIYVISAGKLYEYAINKSALLSYGISMWLNLLNK